MHFFVRIYFHRSNFYSNSDSNFFLVFININMTECNYLLTRASGGGGRGVVTSLDFEKNRLFLKIDLYYVYTTTVIIFKFRF